MIRKALVWTVTAAISLFMTTMPVSAEVVDRIVAVVNQDIITLVQLEQSITPIKKNILASDQTQEQKQQMMRQAEQRILQQLIERALTRQEAVKYNINVLDQDVDQAVENVKQSNGLSQTALVNALESEGLTYDAYREKVRQDILQSMLISRAVRSKVIVTDEEIKAYYDANISQFQGVQKHKLCNLLLDDENKIKEIKSRVEGGESFKELAKQFSMGSNAADGGELGLFDINNFNEMIKNAVKDLKIGEVSGVIPTGQGFQLVFVEDIMMADGKTVEDARDQIHSILYKKQVEEKFKQWMTSLKENAHVKILL